MSDLMEEISGSCFFCEENIRINLCDNYSRFLQKIVSVGMCKSLYVCLTFFGENGSLMLNIDLLHFC